MISDFGTTSSGEAVHRLTLSAGSLSVSVLTLGATLQDVRLAGIGHGLTLGSPAPEAYRDRMAVFGPILGPVANRIGGATALIDGRRHHFEANENGRHTLHSGSVGLHRKVWRIEERSTSHVRLGLALPSGEGGFPGERVLHATWRITPPATLDLVLDATTDEPTLMNLAHHPYWNLDGRRTWGGHRLQVAAETYLPTSEGALPTGEIRSVAGTELDFRELATPRAPFDNTLCLAGGRRPLTPAARLVGANGLALDVATTEPGLQLYDGGATEASDAPGHDGRRYGARAGLALEPQFWPDAPNHPQFPSILLRPGVPWRQHTRYRFSR